MFHNDRIGEGERGAKSQKIPLPTKRQGLRLVEFGVLFMNIRQTKQSKKLVQ